MSTCTAIILSKVIDILKITIGWAKNLMNYKK